MVAWYWIPITSVVTIVVIIAKDLYMSYYWHNHGYRF